MAPDNLISAQAARDWLHLVADPIRLHIVRSLSLVSDATASDLADQASASSQTMRRHLDALVAVGAIHEHPGESDGQTPGRPATRFSLDPRIQKNVRSVLRA
jgi:predicted ArsR family transcriptional regulator